MALGIEGTYWYYGNEWGKDDNSFLMSFVSPVNFMVKSEQSEFYKQYNANGIVTVVDELVATEQGSVFYEINYLPFENTTFLFSGRVDKRDNAKVAFSPRMALIQQIDDNNYLKLVGQQSVRLPNYRELYTVGFSGESLPDPEKLKSIELIYSSVWWQDFAIDISTFYQSVDQIGWTNDGRNDLVGAFNSCGLEASLAYQLNDLKVSLNYSYIKQLEWIPGSRHKTYLSNMGVDSVAVPFRGVGSNRLNNFPLHQLKFISSYKINESFDVHFNARFASQYEQSEMLDIFKTAHDVYGTEETQKEMNDIYDDVLSKGYSKPSFTSNISASYHFEVSNVNMVFSAWVMNVLAINHIRYVYQYWEEGNLRQYPRQVGFVNEPRSYGFSLKAKF